MCILQTKRYSSVAPLENADGEWKMRRALLAYENMLRRWMHGEQLKKVLKYLSNSLL